jgi:PAS domain S-box-containing protein
LEIPYIVNQLREEEKLGILSCKGLQELKKLKIDNNSNDHSQDNSILFVEDEEFNDVIPNKDKITFKKSEEKLEDIALCTADWIWEIDKNGVYTFCSNRVKDILGYSVEEIIGKTPFDLMSKDEVKRVSKIFNKIFANKERIIDLENWNISKNGERVCLLINGKPLFDKKGVFKGYRGVDKDITEKKRLEEELKNKEKFLSDVFNSIGDGLSVLDKNLNVIKTNTYMEEMYSNKMPLVGKKCFEIYQNRKSSCPWCPSLKAMEIKKTQINIVPYPDNEKTKGWLNLSAYPMIDKKGDVYGVIEYVKDITEQIKTQKRLEGISEKLKNIIDSSPSAIITTDEKGIITSWNPACEKIFGWIAEEIIGEFNPILTNDLKNLFFNTMKEKVINIELKVLTKHKKIVDINLSSAPLFEDNYLVGYLGIMTDITEKKKFKDNLDESREHFKKLFNTIVDPLVIVNSRGEFLEVTDKVEEITGFKKDELIGKNFLRTKIVTRKSKMLLIKNLIKRMSGLRLSPYEIEVITKDGRRLPYEVNACKIDYMGKSADMVIFRDIKNRKKAQEELRVTHEKLKMMNEELEEKVKDRTKEIEKLLKNKDEFINQLSHDLKNPLNPIVNLLPILEKSEPDNKNKEIFDILIRNANYMKKLVTKTIDLGRLYSTYTEFFFEDVNLYSEFNNVISNNEIIFKEKNIQIKNNISDNIIVHVDKFRIDELIINLLNNAVKYTKYLGNITLDAKQDNNYVTVSVKDTGVGMNDEQLEHVFDEFYKADSARHDFNSSGLGLSICKRIVEIHNGKIWVESEGLGKGSTFYFTIPKNKMRNGKISIEHIYNEIDDMEK